MTAKSEKEERSWEEREREDVEREVAYEDAVALLQDAVTK